MTQLIILSLVSGLIFANGIPHFVKGITGQIHRTPFSKLSSAVVNVVWGWVNFVVSGLALHYAHPRSHEYRAAGLFAIGMLVMAVFLANVWSSKSLKSGSNK